MRIKDLIEALEKYDVEGSVYFQTRGHTPSSSHQRNVQYIRKGNFLKEIVVVLEEEYIGSTR